MDEWMNERKDGLIDGRKEGRMKGWTDE